MKKLLTLLLTWLVIKSYAQDTIRLRQKIDSIVFAINHSTHSTSSYDSIVADMPALKLYMRTYDTSIVDGKSLKKFVHASRSKSEENGVLKTLITSTIFYYDAGQLVEVEEYLSPDSSHNIWLKWYYKDNKSFLNVAQPLLDTKEKIASINERGKLLVTMAEEMKKQAESKISKM